MMDKKEHCTADKKDCCDNKTMHFQSDQDQAVQTIDLSNKQLQQFVITFVAVFFNDGLIEPNMAAINDYKPPNVLRDIPVLVQSFLL